MLCFFGEYVLVINLIVQAVKSIRYLGSKECDSLIVSLAQFSRLSLAMTYLTGVRSEVGSWGRWK